MKYWNRNKIGLALFSILGVLCVLGLLSRDVSKTHSVSVGIIGGADGPTSVFVAAPGWTAYILPCVSLLIGAAGILWLIRCRKK